MTGISFLLLFCHRVSIEIDGKPSAITRNGLPFGSYWLSCQIYDKKNSCMGWQKGSDYTCFSCHWRLAKWQLPTRSDLDLGQKIRKGCPYRKACQWRGNIYSCPLIMIFKCTFKGSHSISLLFWPSKVVWELKTAGTILDWVTIDDPSTTNTRRCWIDYINNNF